MKTTCRGSGVAAGNAPVAVGSEVRFCLGDIFCPPGDEFLVETLLAALKTECRGRVRFFNEPNSDLGQFAVVEVEGTTARFIVPVNRLKAASQGGRRMAGLLDMGPETGRNGRGHGRA